jgi:RecB family endonuclease NucS
MLLIYTSWMQKRPLRKNASAKRGKGLETLRSRDCANVNERPVAEEEAVEAAAIMTEDTPDLDLHPDETIHLAEIIADHPQDVMLTLIFLREERTIVRTTGDIEGQDQSPVPPLAILHHQ